MINVFSNIFQNINNDVKIGDFGIALTINKTKFSNFAASDFYASPEVKNEECFNSKSDIW